MGPCKTCSHPQCEFLEVSAVSVWLCAGATIFHRSFELLFGEVRFFAAGASFNR